jgi:PhzF family phenazine biosynthesis protein
MRIYQVDAFTDRPFRGNPACVCLLDVDAQAPGAAWMQSFAAEMNLSETAYLTPEEDGFGLRWFTPRSEVSLCGHATLASAHVLWSEGVLAPEEEARFHTLSGLLTARWKGEWIEMDFPAREVIACQENQAVSAALGVTPIYTGQYDSGKGTLYMLEVVDDEAVRRIAPDFPRLAATDARAVIVTAASSASEYDFVSRFFAPQIGIDEDPVTGSAHCTLAPYWSQKLGKGSLIGFQASARSGVVGCTWAGERVLLRGQAVTVFCGELVV